jgi:ubiquinone/menaquinone biosynthesis C-methylase UbiE
VVLGPAGTLDAVRRLSATPELLDGPLEDAAALRGNLRDLRRVNRYLGGSRLSGRAVDLLLAGERGPHSLLDVGTGAADIPIALLISAAARGRDLRIVGLDSRPEVLAAARSIDRRLGDFQNLQLRTADGRALPYPDRTFDIVHASLVVHHFEPRDAVAFLCEARRVARRGVVVNDLVRGRIHWAGALLLTRLATRNPLTRHDGPLSVRRAYTRTEAMALLESAGLRSVGEFIGPFGHRVAFAAVPITEA